MSNMDMKKQKELYEKSDDKNVGLQLRNRKRQKEGRGRKIMAINIRKRLAVVQKFVNNCYYSMWFSLLHRWYVRLFRLCLSYFT